MIAVFGCGVVGEAFINAVEKRSEHKETIRRIDTKKKYDKTRVEKEHKVKGL